MVPPGGTREKSPGVTMPSAPPEAQKHPRHSHHNRGISAEMQCGTAPRAARDFTGEPCSPVNPFFLDGEHPHPADRGPGGLSNLPVGHSSSIPLARSLLDRSSGPFSFRAKREWGAGSTSPWGRNVCALRAHSKARAALRQNRVRLRRETKKKAPSRALLHPTAHSAAGAPLI